jgi:ferredoxin-NADP reductase
MEEPIVKILKVSAVTHDVRQFILEKPRGYTFTPGQATEVSVNTQALKEEKRPFTFTSLSDAPHLEFTIKIYPEHNGVTKALGNLNQGDELILRDVWGAITYKGPGTFIAGGAGVTPFIAILRQLYQANRIENNQLIFSNKTAKDIILREEFEKMLQGNFINTLTREQHDKYLHTRIDKAFIKERITDFNQHFYVCGTDPFVKDIQNILTDLGASPDTVVIEE